MRIIEIFIEHVQKIQLLQFELLNAGYNLEAKDIGLYKSEFIAKSIKTESGEELHPKVAEMYELLSKGHNKNIETKASCAIRSDIIHDILQSTSSAKLCIHCQKPTKKVRRSYRKLVKPLSKEDKEKLR